MWTVGCSVPSLIRQLSKDLEKVATDANIHKVNNLRSSVVLIKYDCRERIGKCDDPSLCPYRKEFVETLTYIRTWLLEQWLQRFGR